MIHAVVFDLDNTLYPHCQYVQGAFAGIADHLARLSGLDARTLLEDMLADWRHAAGRYGRFYRDLLEKHGLFTEENERTCRGIYHAHEPVLAAFPGVPDMLAALKETYRLGLLTDGWAPTQRRKLDALHLAPCFQAILFTGDLGEPYYKPHPRGYRMLLEQLQAAPEEAVFVGDNPDADIRGARQVGMWTVRVLQGEFRDAPDDLLLPAHRRCADPADLPAILADLAREAAAGPNAPT
jgi:putative hydrolase of the HAD superfamily